MSETVLITPWQFASRAKMLFGDYREHFGLDDQDNLESKCDFEPEFAKLICQFEGHNLVPDHCGKPEHYFCTMCNVRREELDV